jgi:signal transduction histidine kinase
MKRFALPLWLEIAGAILLALALSNLATIAFFSAGGEQQFTRFAADMQSQRIAGVAALVLRAPEGLRAELVRELSSPGLRLSLDAAPLVRDGLARDAATEAAIGARLRPEMARGLRAHVLTEAERAVPASPPPPPPEGPAFTGAGRPPPLEQAANLHVSIPAGAQWLNARFGMRPPRPPSWPVFYAGAAVIASLLLASLWMARRVARPLQRLAEAARRLRTGEAREAVPETGPQPVREAARAFNAMSERVTVTLQSQRALMAAVAHDLRTPIAALRVRAEFVTDEDTRTRLLQTISEMQAMTEAVLDAVRIDGSGEPARSVDVATLADSLCVDMAEVGGDVSYASDVALACVCRAAEVRRALRNLIENALRYGVRARVSAEMIAGLAAIHVDDDGSGIPEGELERVFEPFARLEHSRSAETGGYGLGLAIARLIARGHGGDVTLKNRAGGSLRATLTLPLASPP